MKESLLDRISRWVAYIGLALMVTIVMLMLMFVIALLINSIIDVLGSMMDN